MNHNSETTQSLTLYRKYPMNEKIKDRSAYLIGDVFECSNVANFSKATTIHTITDSAFHIMDVLINDSICYKYIRYKMKAYAAPTKIAELQFYGKSENSEHELKGELICVSPNDQILLKQIAFTSDNDYFTWFQLKNYLNSAKHKPGDDNSSELWFGYELEKPVSLKA